MEQKRVYRRIEDLVEVEFSAEASGVTSIIKTMTRDISAGGTKVYLIHKLNPGDLMQLKIILPKDNTPIFAKAEVLRSGLIGVIGDKGQEMLYETRFKFAKMEAPDKNRITQYVYECRKENLDARIKQ